MNQPRAIGDRLLTWLDVERLLKQQTALWSRLPDGIQGIDCFADGMGIRHAVSAATADDWLRRIFGAAYLKADKGRPIRLRMDDARYPVEQVTDAGEAVPLGRTYPLWRDVTYLPEAEDSHDRQGPFPSLWSEGPTLVSFHSFKGGVGRTMAWP